MYLKTRTWAAICVLCLIGAAWFWHLGNERAARQRQSPSATTAPKTNPVVPLLSLQTNKGSTQLAPPNSGNAPFPYRISNTTRKIEDLIRSDSAILLRNALIDSA